MTLSLTELIAGRTANQVEDDLLAQLTAAGFPVTAWQSGSVPRTLIRVEAVVFSTLWGLVATVAKAGFLDLAEGAWLTLHAASRFLLTRIPASFARHAITLNCVASAGPYNITAGQLLVTTTGGVRFRSTNTTNVTVPMGGSAPITVQAETSGIVGNTAPSSIVTPANAGMTMTYGALTTRARDEETDPQLRVRCRARWAERAAGATRDYYLFHLLSAVMPDGETNAGVTRVGWIAPPGDGTFEVIVAGSDGPLSGDQLAAVTAYITDVTRKGHTDTPIVTNAIAVVVTLAVTVTVRSESYRSLAYRTAANAAVVAAAAEIGIGETLDIGRIYAAIYSAVPGGIVNVNITTPAGDTSSTARQVVTVDPSALSDIANWSVA